MTDQADTEALTRARSLGILDRVLTDAENAIYDAGRAQGLREAAEVARVCPWADGIEGYDDARDHITSAIEALGGRNG